MQKNFVNYLMMVSLNFNMLEFLYKLFIGHVHKYEIIDTNPIVDGEQTRIGTSYVQQCTVCGKLNQFKIRG